MTEFWVSKQRYWCKHCKCWLADNASSRKIHENGTGHKMAVSAFLKGTFSKGREDRSAQRELQDELRDIEQVQMPRAALGHRCCAFRFSIVELHRQH